MEALTDITWMHWMHFLSINVGKLYLIVSQLLIQSTLCSTHHYVMDIVTGVEVLENLETLDMTSNILCDHGVLHSLRGLTLLRQLYLEENPLSYNRNHRALAGANLHPMVLQKV